MKQKKLQKLQWKEASSFLVLTEKIIIIVHCLKFASSPEKILHAMHAQFYLAQQKCRRKETSLNAPLGLGRWKNA